MAGDPGGLLVVTGPGRLALRRSLRVLDIEGAMTRRLGQPSAMSMRNRAVLRRGKLP